MASQNITNMITVALADMTGDWYIPVAKKGLRTRKLLVSELAAGGGGGGGGGGGTELFDENDVALEDENSVILEEE